jgi:peptidoglycan/LPS O-acetylase OafA/YrhL
MLQRKQTIWLLLATVFTVLSFKYPFYAVAEKGTGIYKDIAANAAVYTIISGTLAAVLCLVTTFLYQRVKLQLTIALLAALACLLHLVLLYVSASGTGHGNPSLTALFPVLAFALVLLAVTGIRKDKKTLEEMNSNRLR